MEQNKKLKKTFLHDAVDMIAVSAHSVECDDFNRCFRPMSRYEMYSSGILYIFSFFVRYLILLPIRILLLALSLILYIVLLSRAIYYNSEKKRFGAYKIIIKILNFILGARINHYGKKEKLDRPHIFVSNHTSFVDFLILSNYKFPHACISENHGGLFNMLFTLILGRNGSIAFKRSEKLDRSLVKEKLKSHVTQNSMPMLVFPEGTCVNNKYVVMFQKGIFELDVEICPISIKFDRTLQDPYWNRRRLGFTLQLLYLMSRWYLEADIHWLPPLKRKETENATNFAERTRRIIAKASNLKVSLWNGYLKSSPAFKDRDLLKVAFLKTYVKLKNFTEEIIFDNDIDRTAYNNFNVFNICNYKDFLILVLEEYYIYKSLSILEQEQLISISIIKNTVGIGKKHECSCIKLKKNKRRRKKYIFTSCKLDAFKKF